MASALLFRQPRVKHEGSRPATNAWFQRRPCNMQCTSIVRSALEVLIGSLGCSRSAALSVVAECDCMADTECKSLWDKLVPFWPVLNDMCSRRDFCK